MRRNSEQTIRRRRRRFGIVLAVMFGGVAVLPVLPPVMGIIGDVHHSYTATVPTENKGAYLVTDDGAMQLFTWRVQPDGFPPDAPRIAADRLHRLVVVQRAFAEPDQHLLYDLERGRRVQWSRVTTGERELSLHWEGRLEPGRYQLLVPTDGSFGGTNRHFFRVVAPDEEDR